ncbi:hypothetical protein [Haladaptatus salinisoli]|uniref:hypothetical protein n=1 Tax=Haladaptatus salinisoli TaxID=2884876 RepID=UPI001D0B71DB|nr:hypothetical protein [Haladaptatus salinisoli]
MNQNQNDVISWLHAVAGRSAGNWTDSRTTGRELFSASGEKASPGGEPSGELRRATNGGGGSMSGVGVWLVGARGIIATTD